MLDYQYTISLAGIPLRLCCQFPNAAYEEFMTAEEPELQITSDTEHPEFWKQYAKDPETVQPKSVETMDLITKTCNVLLRYRRCLFHGTAFLWHGKAWIFTAPSGTGKTTQYLLWKLRYRDELTILNGDKPILEFRDDGTVWVRPSPWRGKECMGTMDSAPLGGIIYLKQGTENVVERLDPSSAAIRLFLQFLILLDVPQTVDRVCTLETELIRACPVWELTNRGDDASAVLMHDTLTCFEQ